VPESTPHTQGFGNKRVAQFMALAFAVSGGFVALNYSLTPAVVVWVLALVFLAGSFFIERDF
jgi:FtsH-binding integral membrane protein